MKQEENVEVIKKVVQIPIHWVFLAVLFVIVSPIFSVIASVQLVKNARVTAAEEARVKACELFGGILDTYVETPPTTRAGINVQNKWLEFYRLTKCQPLRNK